MGLIGRHPRASRIVPVVVVLVAGLLAGWLVGGGSDKNEAQAAVPVRFTPAAAAEAHPFTPPADVNGAVTISSGGTGSNLVCDRERLIGFLGQQPTKAQAWAHVEAQQPEKLAGYIRALHPSTILAPTRVTDYALVNGKAVGSQIVLAPGTAVLVDDQNSVRVRCRSGDPLLYPIVGSNDRCQQCPSNYSLPKAYPMAVQYAIHPGPPQVVGQPKQPKVATRTVTVQIKSQLPPTYVTQETGQDKQGKVVTKTVTQAAVTQTKTVPGPTKTVTVNHTKTKTVKDTVTVNRTVTVQAVAAAPRTVTQVHTVTVYEGAG